MFVNRYSHLNLEEREKLFAGKESGKSLRTTARELGRSAGTVSRELKRNAKYGRPYIPCRADRLASKRGFNQRWKAPLKNPLVFLYVREHLRPPYSWSPETIAGRLSVDHPGNSVDDETVYRYIYGRRQTRMKLWQYLTVKRVRRMKKGGRRIQRLGKIPEAVSIDKRPKYILKRKQAGHWETDNMEGLRTDESVVSVTVERVARITRLTKLTDRKAGTKTDALVDRLSTEPNILRRTLTADNGKENSEHKVITAQLSLPMFFCHAYHSWEKGSVENTVGRVRRFIPKSTSVDTITQSGLSVIEEKLNNTPRKCLGYLTPNEVWEKIRAASCIR